MRDQKQPITQAELTTFRESRAYIPGPRGAHAIPIDFSACPLAARHGFPGEVMSDTTSRRRRMLAA